MNIFKQIGKSIYGPDLYANLKTQKTSLSVKYYFIFLLILTLISTTIISVGFIPIAQLFLNKDTVNTAMENYPQDLNLKISEGVFSTNVQEPYSLPLTKSDTSEIKNLLVIDTRTDLVSAKSFESYKTIALINKDSIIFQKDSSLEILPVAKNVKDEMNINKETIVNLAEKYLPIVKNLVWFVPIIIFIGLFVSGAIGLIGFFIWALITWLLLKLIKKDHGYMHAYRVTIHAMTLILILSLLTHSNIILTALILLIIILINFKENKNTAMKAE